MSSKILEFHEFWETYERWGKFSDTHRHENKDYVSDRSREIRYARYMERMAKQYERVLDASTTFDARWKEVRYQVLERDHGRCRLMEKLTLEEMKELKANSHGFEERLDVAHVKARSTHPELKYDVNNCVALNRYSHYLLDNQLHPLNGKPISVEEKALWWKRILS